MWNHYLLYSEKITEQSLKNYNGCSFDAPATPLLRQLRSPSIPEVICQESASMIYKAKNGQAPPYLLCLFNSVSAVTKRMLCNSNLNLRLPGIKARFGRNSFAYSGWGLRFGTHCIMTVEQLIPLQHLK